MTRESIIRAQALPPPTEIFLALPKVGPVVEPALAPSGAHPDGAPAPIPYLWVAGRRGVGVFLSAEEDWMTPLHAELEELDEANGHGLAAWVDALAIERFGDRAAGLHLDPEASSLSIAAEDPVLLVDVLDATAEELARRTGQSRTT